MLSSRLRDRNTSVGSLLAYFSNSFEEEIKNRQFFYKSSKLVSNSIINIDASGFGSSEITQANVTADRRMLDFIAGLNTEINELVEGSHLYFPTVNMDQIVLPKENKDLIIETVSQFEEFSKVRKSLGFDDKMGYGLGMMVF